MAPDIWWFRHTKKILEWIKVWKINGLAAVSFNSFLSLLPHIFCC